MFVEEKKALRKFPLSSKTWLPEYVRTYFSGGNWRVSFLRNGVQT
jgi:hypothetical protein